MAKKKTEDSTGTAPRRATARRSTKPDLAAAPVDIASVTPETPIATAADRGSSFVSSAARPTADEIAQLAYQRYLSRGGGDGRDFEDWIEAERELTRRR